MPFIHPAIFFGGAAAASVPVVIHLLNRRRFKVVDWAAMRFLLESVRRNRRRVRIEELILLALRCLAIFLLAMAVGRLIGCAGAQAVPVLAQRGQTDHVFVLDDSVSMGQKLGDTTAFDLAAGELAEIIDKLPRSDRVAVLLTSRPEDSGPMATLQSVSKIVSPDGWLKSLRPSDTAGGLRRTLRAGGKLFTPASVKHLYVLGDFRRVDYEPGRVEEIRREMKALRDEGVVLRLLSYGASPRDNLTIEGVQVLDKVALASVPVRVQLRVRNNGSEPAENVTVRFSTPAYETAGAKLPVRTIRSIEPGEEKIVQVGYAFPDPGAGVIEGRLKSDSLPGDNVVRLALEVRQARKILIIDGEPDVSDPANTESFFLLIGLDPNGNRSYGNAVDVVSYKRMADVNFHTYDAVILANVGAFPRTKDDRGELGYGSLDQLAGYVRGGGGLAIFTGDQLNPTFYNGPFYAEGAGLCPLKVTGRWPQTEREVRQRRRFVRLLRDSVEGESVMRSFHGDLAQFTQLLRFYGFTRTEVPGPVAGVGPVKVLARFDNAEDQDQHSPAIVSRSYGDGRVVMVCTAADTEWSDWPKDYTFVTFLNDLMDYISRAAAKDFTASVGEPIGYTLDRGMLAARITLSVPGDSEEGEVSLAPRSAGTRKMVGYADTRYAGIYRLRVDVAGEARTVMFARNVDPSEGRLAVAGEQELRALLQVELSYQDRLRPTADAQTGTDADRNEYWKAMLMGMLLVLAAEVFLGQRFGHYN